MSGFWSHTHIYDIVTYIYIYVYTYIYICTSCSCCVFGLSCSLCFAADVTCFSPYGRPFAPQNQRRWQVTPRTPERRKARIYCNIWAKGSAAWTDLSWQSLVWLETCFHPLCLSSLMFTLPLDQCSLQRPSVQKRPSRSRFESVWQFPVRSWQECQFCNPNGTTGAFWRLQDAMAPWHWWALVGGALRPTQFFNVGKTLPENPGSVQWWLVCLVGMFGWYVYDQSVLIRSTGSFSHQPVSLATGFSFCSGPWRSDSQLLLGSAAVPQSCITFAWREKLCRCGRKKVCLCQLTRSSAEFWWQ